MNVGQAFAQPAQETAASRFKAAHENERRTREIMRERELDWRIAERAGEPGAVSDALGELNSSRTEWHGFYKACQDSAKDIIRELGVEPSDFKVYL